MRTADDQPVPTLRDWINDQSVDRTYGFLEIKVSPTAAQWKSFVTAVTSRASAGTPRPVISSFDPAVLDQVPTVEGGALTAYTRALIRSTGDFDPATVTPHASIVLVHHDSVTKDRLVKWTSKLRVYAWADPAADPASEWDRMAGLNATSPTTAKIDGYVTSSPAAFAARMASRSC
jgi:glycerophosphoryl diester phosphodiesterase